MAQLDSSGARTNVDDRMMLVRQRIYDCVMPHELAWISIGFLGVKRQSAHEQDLVRDEGIR